MGSKGSVIPFFLKKKEEGILPITDPKMTRFNISIDEGVEMVLHALKNTWGGEILIPKIPSYRITDLAKAIGPDCEISIIGIRPGEKIHEEMITASDSFTTYDLGNYYVILPQKPIFDISNFIEKFKAIKVKEGFNYNSGKNHEFLSVEQISELINIHIN